MGRSAPFRSTTMLNSTVRTPTEMAATIIFNGTDLQESRPHAAERTFDWRPHGGTQTRLGDHLLFNAKRSERSAASPGKILASK